MVIDQARELGGRAKEERRAGEQEAALADIIGQIGGTLREQDELLQAAAAYDEGYSYEARYALASTYNALNRLVTRILLCPNALADPEALRRHDQLPWIDVPAELARLRDATVARDQSDIWAVEDFALIAALTGTDPGDALDRLAGESDAFMREASRPIVERLAELDTPRRADLERLARALAV